MSETTELKPCPFCNSGRIGMDDVGGNVYFVICPDCDAYGPNSNTEEGAAFKWNNPVPSALAARVERLEARIEALVREARLLMKVAPTTAEVEAVFPRVKAAIRDAKAAVTPGGEK